MLLGDARVSTDDQDLSQQRTALRTAGCVRIYEEKVCGANRGRPHLARLIDQLRADNVVTVTRLDRLARSTRDLLDLAEQLQQAGAGLCSLAEPWADTTSPAGRMILTVFAGLAEFERTLIAERTGTGRVAARACGVRFGRPPKLTADQIALARRLVDEGRSPREAARLLTVHVSTLYRACPPDVRGCGLRFLTGPLSVSCSAATRTPSASFDSPKGQPGNPEATLPTGSLPYRFRFGKEHPIPRKRTHLKTFVLGYPHDAESKASGI